MKTKNNYPSSEFEAKDKCPSCGSYCNIHTDLDENDECNDCRQSMHFHECSECNIRCNCTTAECSCSCKKTGRHFIGIEKDEKYF